MQKKFFIVFILFFPILLRGQVLYEISGNGLPSRSYIFAECKWVSTTYLDSVPQLLKSYGHCQQVVVECFLNTADAATQMQRMAQLPDTVNYKDLYTSERYQLINQALFNRLHIGLEQLGRMRPSAIGELFLNALYKEELGYDEQRSMENFFPFIAIEQGNDILSLDNLEQTMQQLFYREPLHYQTEELYNMIVYWDREVAVVRELIAAYRKGELADMSYIVRSPENKSTMSFSDYQVWSSRWSRWVKTLGEYMSQRSSFVVLDARYLGGDKGFLQALRSAGYKVKAVKIDRRE